MELGPCEVLHAALPRFEPHALDFVLGANPRFGFRAPLPGARESGSNTSCLPFGLAELVGTPIDLFPSQRDERFEGVALAHPGRYLRVEG